MDPAKAAENAILEHLQSHDEIPDSQQFAASSGFFHDVVENVIKSLCGSRTIEAKEIKEERWALTDEGKSYVDSGSPEVQFFRSLPSEGEILMEDLEKKLDPTVYKVGPSAAIVNKWVTMRKEKREISGGMKPETFVYVSRKINDVEDNVKDLLKKIEAGEAVDERDVDALKRRKLVILQTWSGYSIRKGPEYVLVREKAATDLTREHIQRNMEPKYDISVEESKRIIGVIAATGKFWHDWEVLRSLLSSQLKQALEEYPESQMVGGDGSQPSSLSGETYAELATRLEEALLSFSDGPPFTLQRLCEILLSPKSTYKTLSKLALALEKNLLVTSTITRSTEPYPTGLLQKSAESEKGSSEPQVHHSSPTPNEARVHHSSPTPNVVEALAGDADEEMVEAEADEEAVNSDTDMQEDNGCGKSESSSAVAADSDPPTSSEEHGSPAA